MTDGGWLSEPLGDLFVCVRGAILFFCYREKPEFFGRPELT